MFIIVNIAVLFLINKLILLVPKKKKKMKCPLKPSKLQKYTPKTI